MKTRSLHPWTVDIQTARRIQERLRTRVSFVWKARPVRLVAAADVSFPEKHEALAVVVVLTYPDLAPVETVVRRGRCRMPYIPGFLSFREIPTLLKAFRSVKSEPDLILFDGQGVAHPRRMGLAAHAGLILDKPSIGCAKSRLFGEYREPGTSRGEYQYLVTREGDVIGAALRTRTGVRPVYVSVGHRIDLETAMRFVLAAAPRYRIPEPLRLADLVSKEERT
ncbi:MAG: deoxyribonuclease V [Candidatus Eisenbacteria sp.]|nr:deoxyribonuclease V [Candidatus Eisenbacteria bacterium]